MTDEQIKHIAELVRADEEAKYAHRWLWNNADSEPVQRRFFETMVRSVLNAVETVKSK